MDAKKGEKMKKLLRVVIGLIFIGMLMIHVAESTEAAVSYPRASMDQKIWNGFYEYFPGDTVALTYSLYLPYQYQKINVKVYNSSGQVVASEDRDLRGPLATEWHWDWNTAGCAPGKYKVVATLEFYAEYEWHEAPTDDSHSVVLHSESERPKIGWNCRDGKWFYWKKDGGKLNNEWLYENGTWYCFNSNGWMVTGWAKVDNDTYYFGTDGKMKTGWQKLDGTYYYFAPNGKCQINKWVQDAGKWYYMGEDGTMVTGWQEIGDKTYYFSDSGVMQLGWVWYETSYRSSWRYLKSSGAMAQGWCQVDGVWYYFIAGDGLMLTEWFTEGESRRFYFKSSGAMATGWVSVDGSWYYMNSDGVMQTNKWVDGIYYVKEDGKMATNEWVDNGRYYVDESGKWFLEVIGPVE